MSANPVPVPVLAPLADMHPADVNAALRKRGSSQAAIARAEGVHRASVCKVINGRERSRRVEAAVARAAGLPLVTIWPSRH